MEYLSGKRQDFTDKLLKINNLSARRQDSTNKLLKINNLSGRRRGFTDKRGLRFTDRHSLDFSDTCHLDFPDTLYLNFPDASYLTKRPKSGITNSAQKNGVIYRQVGGSMSIILGRKWEQGIHIILRQSQYTADLTIGRTEIIVQFLGKVKFLWTCQVM